MKRAALATVLCAFTAGAARDNEVRVDLGLASAVGFYGLTYTRTLSQSLALEAGVGGGISGAQFSLMPKYRFGRGAVANFYLGLGPSLSVRRLGPGDVGGAFRRFGEGVWLNGEAGLEIEGESGLSFAAAVGGTVGLWGNSMLLHPDLHDYYVGIRGLATPQARIGLGYAF